MCCKKRVLLSRIFYQITRFVSQTKHRVLLRSFGGAFFVLWGIFMISIELIRELHCYKKMYNTLQRTVTDCVGECRDLVVRERLIKAQQESEDIYTGEIYDYKELNEDERVILALLSFIMDTEISRVTDADMKIVNDCVDWSLVLQNKNIELSKEFIEEQVKRIFEKVNEEEGSEQ